MANFFKFKDTQFNIGDSVNILYKIREGTKERQQRYAGMIIRVKGQTAQGRTVTIRRVTKSGIGVERIIPIESPNLTEIKLVKKGFVNRSKIYFARNLSGQEIRRKIYRQK